MIAIDRLDITLTGKHDTSFYRLHTKLLILHRIDVLLWDYKGFTERLQGFSVGYIAI